MSIQFPSSVYHREFWVMARGVMISCQPRPCFTDDAVTERLPVWLEGPVMPSLNGPGHYLLSANVHHLDKSCKGKTIVCPSAISSLLARYSHPPQTGARPETEAAHRHRRHTGAQQPTEPTAGVQPNQGQNFHNQHQHSLCNDTFVSKRRQ